MLLCFYSCSKDDESSKDSSVVLEKMQGNTWVYTNGSFTGINITGTTDPYFFDTALDFSGETIDKVQNGIYGKINYSSGLEWSTRILAQPNDKVTIEPFIDNGVKVSHALRMYHYRTENLYSSTGEEIKIDLVRNLEVKSITADKMVLTKTVESYEITYFFSKKN